MEEIKKVYEEPILEVTEDNLSNYRIWLNELLEDEAIPYKTQIKRIDTGLFGIMFDYDMVIEFYVSERDVQMVSELIEEYKNSSSMEECEELNVSEDELGYTEEDIW